MQTIAEQMQITNNMLADLMAGQSRSQCQVKDLRTIFYFLRSRISIKLLASA